MTTVSITGHARSAMLSCLEQAARAELRASSYTALRHVRCCVSDGRIVLCGTVPSFYLKQMAQCLLHRQLGGELQIANRLEVETCQTAPRRTGASHAAGRGGAEQRGRSAATEAGPGSQ